MNPMQEIFLKMLLEITTSCEKPDPINSSALVSEIHKELDVPESYSLLEMIDLLIKSPLKKPIPPLAVFPVTVSPETHLASTAYD